MSEQKLSMNYVLEQIEKIMADTEYLHSTIAALEGMGPAAGPGDITGQAKAEALAVVESIISSVGVGMDEGVAVQINEILDTIRHM